MTTLSSIALSIAYLLLSFIYLLFGSAVLGNLAKWQKIDLYEERKKYKGSWHFRYLFCLFTWPIIALYLFLMNSTVVESND